VLVSYQASSVDVHMVRHLLKEISL